MSYTMVKRKFKRKVDPCVSRECCEISRKIMTREVPRPREIAVKARFENDLGARG